LFHWIVTRISSPDDSTANLTTEYSSGTETPAAMRNPKGGIESLVESHERSNDTKPRSQEKSGGDHHMSLNRAKKILTMLHEAEKQSRKKKADKNDRTDMTFLTLSTLTNDLSKNVDLSSPSLLPSHRRKTKVREDEKQTTNDKSDNNNRSSKRTTDTATLSTLTDDLSKDIELSTPPCVSNRRSKTTAETKPREKKKSACGDLFIKSSTKFQRRWTGSNKPSDINEKKQLLEKVASLRRRWNNDHSGKYASSLLEQHSEKGPVRETKNRQKKKSKHQKILSLRNEARKEANAFVHRARRLRGDGSEQFEAGRRKKSLRKLGSLSRGCKV
jgi:hypothetical protein